jgi:putative transposase
MDESGTTRTCSECPHVVLVGIAPGINAWTCPACGYRHIRDGNAAKNGLDRLKQLVEAASGNPHLPLQKP